MLLIPVMYIIMRSKPSPYPACFTPPYLRNCMYHQLKNTILKELSELEGRIDIYEQENDEEIDDRISGDPFLDLL